MGKRRIVIVPPAHFGVMGVLLLLLAPFLFGIVLPAALEAALGPLGMPNVVPFVLALMALSPFLGFVNVVLRRREVHVRVLDVGYISLFGIPVPVARPREATFESLLAINVGGALVPLLIAALMTAAEALAPRSLELLSATAATTVLTLAATYKFSRVVEGIGIVVPAFLPPAVALLTSVALALPLGLLQYIPALSYEGAVYGTLIGADVLNLLSRWDDITAWLVSIGGAGTFDGIFVSGVLSMVLSALLV